MNNATGCLIQEPGVLMMLDIGAPLKIGEYKWCEDYLNYILEKLPADFVNEQYQLIKFNVAHPELGFEPEGYNLTADEICTLFNYLQNFSIGREGWAKLSQMSGDELKNRLSEIKTRLDINDKKDNEIDR